MFDWRFLERARVKTLILLIFFFGSEVFAGGFEVSDNGTRAHGRGGAFVAGVDTPSALYFNPAALTRLDGVRFSLDLNLMDYNLSYQRDPYVFYDPPREEERYERTILFEEIENEGPIQPAPMFFASYDFSLPNTVFGAGLYGPPSYGFRSYPNMDTEADQPSSDTPVVERAAGQSYMLVSAEIPLVYPSISVAHAFESLDLSVGVTFQMAVFMPVLQEGLDVNPGGPTIASPDNIGGFQVTESPTTYTLATVDVFGTAPTGILGVLWEPDPRVAIGASYRPRFTLANHGTIDLEIPPSLEISNADLDDDEVTFTIKMPDIVRVGALYRNFAAAGQERFNLEFNLVYEGWHVMEEMTLDLEGELVDDFYFPEGREINRLHMTRNYKDTFSFRFGGDYLGWCASNRGLILRAGGYYETPASEEAWTNVDFTSFERFSGAFGASYHFGRFSLDGALSYVWSPERVVDEGEYPMLAPVWECENPSPANEEACASHNEVPTHAVNNGTYLVNYQFLSLGVTYGW